MGFKWRGGTSVDESERLTKQSGGRGETEWSGFGERYRKRGVDIFAVRNSGIVSY